MKHDLNLLYDIFIEEALASDPITMAQVFMRFRHGLHLKEIGERTDMNSEAVRRRLSKVSERAKTRYVSEILGD